MHLFWIILYSTVLLKLLNDINNSLMVWGLLAVVETSKPSLRCDERDLAFIIPFDDNCIVCEIY